MPPSAQRFESWVNFEGVRSRNSLESLRVGRQREEEGRLRPGSVGEAWYQPDGEAKDLKSG